MQNHELTRMGSKRYLHDLYLLSRALRITGKLSIIVRSRLLLPCFTLTALQLCARLVSSHAYNGEHYLPYRPYTRKCARSQQSNQISKGDDDGQKARRVAHCRGRVATCSTTTTSFVGADIQHPLSLTRPQLLCCPSASLSLLLLRTAAPCPKKSLPCMSMMQPGC